MGKRKRKSSQDYIKRKIRRLEKRLRQYENSESSDEVSAERAYDGRIPAHTSSKKNDSVMKVMESDTDSSDSQWNIRSAVHAIDVHNEASPQAECILPDTLVDLAAAGPSTSQLNTSAPPISSADPPIPTLSTSILEVLGEAKGKQEVFGPNIQAEISERWGRILCDGLNKDQKKALAEKILVPENFQLVKAPKLNPEIAAVMIESTRNHDMRLEKAQNQVGIGIAALTSLTSSLIEQDKIDEIELIKQLSETNQILMDLHFENTLNRRKLITYTLYKKFLDIVQNIKRDTLIFGDNLTDKIKASKSAERSGLQLRKTTNATEVSTLKNPTNQQENWKGPPRQAHRGNRQGGAKSRPVYHPPPLRRPAPMLNRYQTPSRTQSKPQSKTQ